jgi:hypothetical protein
MTLGFEKAGAAAKHSQGTGKTHGAKKGKK